MIPGIDVSHWQSEIDWAKVKAAGVKFAFIKASEFPDKKITMYVDDKFEFNRKGAEANGIYWGAYHFFRTHIDPIIQAEAFCKQVGSVTSLPLVLDLEVAGCKGSKLIRKVKSFVETVTSVSGRKPIIYTSGGFWRPFMTYEKLTDVDWAIEYPLWMARYTSQWPGNIYPWSGWDFWQYSDKGRIPGIKTYVDLNWFVGSLEDLKTRFLPQKGSSKEIFEEVGDEIDQPIHLTSESKNTKPTEISMDNELEGMHILNEEKIPPSIQKGKTEKTNTANDEPSFLSFMHGKFNKKNKKPADPEQSQEWIEDVIYRDKKKN
ncbi:MAG: glycoside hydrolase family 25 protein [Anaerolineaceae bacterium]